jgi:hypothetical protein
LIKNVLNFVWKRAFLGAISLILGLFLFILGSWVWNVLAGIDYRFFDSPVLNGLIKIAVVFTLVFFVGLLVSWRWSRSLILFFLSKIPGLRTLSHSFLNHEFVERFKKGQLLEAMFEDVNGRWGFGIVTNEFKAPENPKDWKSYRENPDPWEGELIDWCTVLGPPTAPLAITAQMWRIPKNSLVFTGSTAKDTTITVASLGFIFALAPFRREEK